MYRGIKGLVFDVYGTLFDPHSVTSTCEELFPCQGSELSHLWRAKQLEYAWLRSLMDRYEDFWHVTESALVFACKAMSLRLEPAVHSRLMEAYLNLDPYPDVREALPSLVQYMLAILSNGTPQMLYSVIRRAKFGNRFTHVMSVDEARTYKPSPRAYQIASQKTGVAPEAMAFISSNSWDIMGAKAFGFFTCWVNRFGLEAEELGFIPDITVRTLTDLAGQFF